MCQRTFISNNVRWQKIHRKLPARALQDIKNLTRHYPVLKVDDLDQVTSTTDPDKETG